MDAKSWGGVSAKIQYPFVRKTEQSINRSIMYKRYPYTPNYKTSLKEIKEDLNKWEDFQCL